MNTVGYKNPPRSTRFKKGRSGNPRGRPIGRHNRPPFDTVLGQTITIKEAGAERKVSAAEAFLLLLTKRALDGDTVAAQLLMQALDDARSLQSTTCGLSSRFTVHFVRPGSVNSALEILRMATNVDRYQPNARILLEPWIVEEALARLNDRQLSLKEQAIVVRAVRRPHKVQWPAWWQIKPQGPV